MIYNIYHDIIWHMCGVCVYIGGAWINIAPVLHNTASSGGKMKSHIEIFYLYIFLKTAISD